VMESADAAEKTAVAAGSFATPSSAHLAKYFNRVRPADQCIMYGETSDRTTDRLDFCEACKGFLRATDISDISRVW
jgi:hypothetical protein